MTVVDQLAIKHELVFPGVNGRIGLVALATDITSETDLRRMLPDGVDLFTNRVLNANPLTLDNLLAMRDDIQRAAAGILPGTHLDVMIYGCTSGTVAIGEQVITHLMQEGRGNYPVTTPVTALFAALDKLAVKKLSILTPYTESVNRAMLDTFADRGVEVVNICGLGFDDDIDIGGIPPEAIVAIAPSVMHEDADALFLSCTALHSAEVAERIEQQIGKPVITSNQALAWHALELIGKPYTVKGFGCLFD